MHFSKPPMGTPLDWENPLNKGTVMALAMNEGHGDKVQDLSLNGNHGTLNNFAFPPTVTSGWNPGQTGVWLNLDGVNDYINCGNNASLNCVDAITIGAILNTKQVDLFDRLIKKGNGTAYQLDLTATGEVRFYLKNSVGASAVATTTSSVGDGVSHTIIATYDGSNIKIYFDGLEEDSAGIVGSIAVVADSVRIGHGDAAARFINGYIDQPRIQCRAWTAKEVMDYAINPWQVYLDE